MYKDCAITFNLHEKLFHRVATIVVFNNVDCRHQKKGPSDLKVSINCALILETLRTISSRSQDNNLSKAEFLQEGILFCTPSLEIFINRNIGFQKN